MSKLRKIDDLKGRQRLAELGFDGSAMPHTLRSHVISISARHQGYPGTLQDGDHESTTDALLARKGNGKEAKLSYNRNRVGTDISPYRRLQR
jgi:hypothetical protein